MVSSIVLAVAFLALLVYHFKSAEAWAEEREALVVLAKAQTHHEARDYSKAVDRVKRHKTPEDPEREKPPTKTVGL